MEIIAITKNSSVRIVQCGDEYIRQIKMSFLPVWSDVERVKEEWIASKWILEYGMEVSTDYPTIAEIKERQEK